MHKVLIVSPFFFAPENRDGVSKINYNILKRNDFYEADFLCLGPINRKSLDKEHINIKTFSLCMVIKRLSLLQKIKKMLFSYSPQLILDKDTTKKLASKINEIEDHYDSILITTLAITRTIDNLNESAKNKTSLSAIDSLSLLFKRRYQSQRNLIKKLSFWVEYKKSKFFESKYYNKYKKVCFVSDIDKRYIDGLLNIEEKTYAIPNGVNLSVFKPLQNITPSPYQLIFTGNLSYAPNTEACEFLVKKLMPELLTFSKRYKLVLAGSNPPEFLKRLNHPNIKVTGYVDDLNLLLNQSSLYVSPLFSGAGIKNKILEAIAAESSIMGSSISFDGIDYQDKKIIIIKSSKCSNWVKQIIDFFEKPKEKDECLINSSKLDLSWYNSTSKYYKKIFKEL